MGVFMTFLNVLVNRCPHSYAVGTDASFIVLNTKAALKEGACLGKGWGGLSWEEAGSS